MSGTHGIAQPVRRREDVRLLTGAGRFADDVNRDGQAYASFVRSPVAHGTIRGIDMDAASKVPGVIAVFAGDDLAAAGVGHIVARWPKYQSAQIQSDPPLHTPRPGLAQGKVRHVGEAVVLVVAETRAQADDGAAMVELDIEEHPAAVSITDALAPGAPTVWDDAPGNIGQVWHRGDREGADAAFADAAHVTRLSLVNTRLAANPMEPRSSVVAWDGTDERFTLVASSQGVQYFMEILCEQVFDIERTHMRVLTGDVGGGFGVKEQPFPEDIAILFAARALDRSVKWTGSRSEHFLGEAHARDAMMDAELALDAEGNFTALRVTLDEAMGAYYACNGTGMPLRNFPNGLPLVYRTPIVDIDVRLVVTHNLSVGPYRGAGREQASYVMERLVDQAARETGHDPVELRRQNMIPPGWMPYATPVGRTYDSGEFEAVLDKTLALADWDGYGARAEASAANGKIRGRGIASYLECIGGFPHEGAKIEFRDDGDVDLVVATMSQGQGHETSFVQVVAERLELPFDRVHLRQGDSDTAPLGIATIASRSMTMAGAAIALTCDAVVEKGKLAAAHLLEAAVADIEFADGQFRVIGTDRQIALLDLAAQTRMMITADAPADMPASLDSEEEFDAADQFFPNGCHVCELEIDPDTGVITLDRYTAIDDCGTVINPPIVHGQVHGGVMQGIGQVLLEQIVYDRNSGQLLTGSFMDYAMPRADDLPELSVDFHEVPSPANPLGVKGVGEAGIVGALPAIMNAIADALVTQGKDIDFDMPATPEKIWRALHG
ncbi:MAG: xanthine dehydrogenase family protein molybdopterin-binding subunit [Rhodospirillaceae bacterium]|jgi:aerobic carbon-monoxide dehydrogenase large subunit|nr:xanthine dehydrogenase family protein molybdopterin-binding subunit [Rhodospirillaceae bacterium]MBT6534926.1 xanthine dehydrogenase family protein molybdopterin-binding subunit [Rhodospirillaceae bacterium]